MRILSKKRFQFRSDAGVFTTAGGMTIEDAPDWISGMPLFALAVADEAIVPFQEAAVTKNLENELEQEDKPKKTAARK